MKVRLAFFIWFATVWPIVTPAQQVAAASIAAATKGMQRHEGFMPFFWDSARGRVLLEVPAFDRDVPYYISAASGGGSVELPLDRGILRSLVIHFQRSGPRVHLPKIAGNKDGNLREARPSAMTATTNTSSHNLLRDVPIDVI